MQDELKRLIKSMAQEIHNIFDIPPCNTFTDLKEVVQKIGGTVEYTNDYKDSICKLNNDTFLIKIPLKLSDERANFTIAQRLGDLFLHMHYMTNPDKWNAFPTNTPYENPDFQTQEMSNFFAGYFLMPEEEFFERSKQTIKNGMINTKKVAKYFGVSISTASWWGIQLGYFERDF